MDQWGDPLKPVPKWQNRAGYALFTACMGYLFYVIVMSKYRKKQEEDKQEELEKARRKKVAAIQMYNESKSQAS